MFYLFQKKGMGTPKEKKRGHPAPLRIGKSNRENGREPATLGRGFLLRKKRDTTKKGHPSTDGKIRRPRWQEGEIFSYSKPLRKEKKPTSKGV